MDDSLTPFVFIVLLSAIVLMAWIDEYTKERKDDDEE
jgi:hypothetical protein